MREPTAPILTDPPSQQARTEHWLRWAFGVVVLCRLLFPFFDSPLAHLFSDPARHWSNGARFLVPDLIGAGDPFLYQLWIYLLRSLSDDDPPSIVLACGLLCAAMPYGWYRALRELLPRAQALTGGLIIGLVPAFIGIYAYFMTETLLLTLTGFAFWATFRAARKRTAGAFALASALWVCALFTRSIALPMAALCLATLWVTQRQRLAKAATALAAFAIVALPAGLHARATLGFFAPLGNLYLSQIYSASGKHDISIDAGALGGWGFGTPSFYNPTFYPFSDWTTDRRGTVAIRIDVSRGRATWFEEKQRVQAARTFPWWRQYRENLLYLLFGQSWPDNDPNSLSGLATVWTRWLWPPLMLMVACGVVRRGFRGREWLLPACALGMLLSLAVQRDGIIEGRYRKPIDPVLVAAAIVLYGRRGTGRARAALRKCPPTTPDSSSTSMPAPARPLSASCRCCSSSCPRIRCSMSAAARAHGWRCGSVTAWTTCSESMEPTSIAASCCLRPNAFAHMIWRNHSILGAASAWSSASRWPNTCPQAAPKR